MRTITISRTAYTVDELKAECPAAFEAALDRFAHVQWETYDDTDDWASLQAVEEIAEMRKHYYPWHEDYPWIYEEGARRGDLKGKRAWAWLENVVLGPKRIPWRPYVRVESAITFKPKGKTRTRFEGGTRGYRCGQVEPCPFTGYYMDEVLIDDLRTSFKEGLTVKEALIALRDIVIETIEESRQASGSEDSFLNWARDLDVEFYDDGSQV